MAIIGVLGAGLPPNAAILWIGLSCPAGFAFVAALDGKLLRGGAAYNASAGGAATHQHAGIDHTHGGSLSLGNPSSTKSIATGVPSKSVASSTHSHGGNKGFSTGNTAVPSDAVAHDVPRRRLLLCASA